MVAPTIPSQYQDIDWTQRAQVLNAIGTLINNFITYWSSNVADVTIPDAGSGNVFLHPTATFAAYITALNAINTEFTLGVTALSVPDVNMDINNFQTYVNEILTYIAALLVAKP